MTDQAMQPLQPLVVRNDEGEARWWFGALAGVKATAADTGGQMTIVEVTEPPGIEARGDQRARPEPHPPAPPETDEPPEQLEGLKAIVKEHGYELLRGSGQADPLTDHDDD